MTRTAEPSSSAGTATHFSSSPSPTSRCCAITAGPLLLALEALVEFAGEEVFYCTPGKANPFRVAGQDVLDASVDQFDEDLRDDIIVRPVTVFSHQLVGLRFLVLDVDVISVIWNAKI